MPVFLHSINSLATIYSLQLYAMMWTLTVFDSYLSSSQGKILCTQKCTAQSCACLLRNTTLRATGVYPKVSVHSRASQTVGRDPHT